MRWLTQMVGTAAAATLMAVTGASAQEKLTFNMSWLPQGSVVGPIVANDKGWFKEAGLEVAISRGYGGSRTANELDQGQFEVGYVDPISLVQNRANGGKIKLIGTINSQWPAGICFASKRHNIKSLDDLKALKMGGGSASPVHLMIPAWLEANGKPKDLIQMLRMDPAVINSALLEGKVDLAECWLASNRPIIMQLAKANNVEVDWIRYSDHKLDAYGSGFAAREDMIQKKPDVLRKFLQASYRGYELARANPGEAADILVKLYSTLSRSVVLEQIEDINKLLIDSGAADKGMGHIRDDRMASTVAFVENAFNLKGKVKVADTYTNALLGR